MGSVVVDRERRQQVNKRMYYLPDVDEYNSSSEPLTDLTLGEVLSVAPAKSKALKHGYIADLTREGGISPCSLMLGLLYIKRLSQTNPKYLKTVSSRELFLIAMVMASKYMNDEGEMEALTNTEWAEIGCTPKAALDKLERNFLEAIDWRLYVPLEEYYSFVTGMEGRVALRQASKRGWLTYTDLAAVWEATDFENSMLAASQQTAKVMCGSTAVYLVCLATLFATSQSLQMAPDTWSASGTGLNLFKSSSALGSNTIVPSGVIANQSVEHQPFPPSPCISEHNTIFGAQCFDGSKSRNGGWIGTESPHWHTYRGSMDRRACGYYGNLNVGCQQYFKAHSGQGIGGSTSRRVSSTLCVNCSNRFRNGCRTSALDYHHRGTASVTSPSEPSEVYNGTTNLLWKHDGTLESMNATPFNPSTSSPATHFNPSTPSPATHFNPSSPPSFLTLPLLI